MATQREEGCLPHISPHNVGQDTLHLFGQFKGLPKGVSVRVDNFLSNFQNTNCFHQLSSTVKLSVNHCFHQLSTTVKLPVLPLLPPTVINCQTVSKPLLSPTVNNCQTASITTAFTNCCQLSDCQYNQCFQQLSPTVKLPVLPLLSPTFQNVKLPVLPLISPTVTNCQTVSKPLLSPTVNNCQTASITNAFSNCHQLSNCKHG